MKRHLKIILSLSIAILFQQWAYTQDCTDNCVWPGDTNNNGICNNLDILPIGIAFGTEGPFRNFTSPDLWQPEEAADWTENLPISGVNYKHIDANGDGFIDDFDTNIIGDNFNKVNDSFTALAGNTLSGDDLFIVLDKEEVAPGEELTVQIHLGTPDRPIEDLYGIAFSIAVNSEYVASTSPPTFVDSWMGTTADLLNYEKVDLPTWSQFYLGSVRTDGTSRTGSGVIAEFRFVIADVIIAIEQDTTQSIPFLFEFQNVLAINKFEEEIPIGVRHDSITIHHASLINSTPEIIDDQLFSIVPNPVSSYLYLQCKSSLSDVKIYNQFGQLVFWQPNKSETPFHFNLSDLAAGTYVVSAATNGKRVRQRFLKI